MSPKEKSRNHNTKKGRIRTLFEVFRDKQKLMSTNDISAIYDKCTLNAMRDAGYKFKLNGKVATAEVVAKFVKESKNNKKEEMSA